jgi:hypothetical protein
MKRIHLLLVLAGLLTLITESSKAQEVGFRAGDIVGGNVALDLLISTQKYGLLHADISLSDNGTLGTFIGIEALSDFIYEPIGGEALNLYVGAGVSALFATETYLGGSLEAGLSYYFNNIPLVISGDWRPTLWLIGPATGTEFVSGNFGFNLRFVFNR